MVSTDCSDFCDGKEQQEWLGDVVVVGYQIRYTLQLVMFKNRRRLAKISRSSGQHQQPSCCRKLFCNCEWHVMSHWPGADYDRMRFCRSEVAYLSRICPNGFAVRIYLVFACIYPHTLGEKARSPPQGSHRSVIVVAKITVIAKDSMCHLFPSFHWYVMDGIIAMQCIGVWTFLLLQPLCVRLILEFVLIIHFFVSYFACQWQISQIYNTFQHHSLVNFCPFPRVQQPKTLIKATLSTRKSLPSSLISVIHQPLSVNIITSLSNEKKHPWSLIKSLIKESFFWALPPGRHE